MLGGGKVNMVERVGAVEFDRGKLSMPWARV